MMRTTPHTTYGRPSHAAKTSRAGLVLNFSPLEFDNKEVKEVKRHSYYLKPGEKKRVKQALARKRARKKIRREPD
jgi:hypothetical protein